ncbi:hypothetical protein QA596_06230 [Balneolales bacterium ANBcel1]|nr:hypothetical protein [Balneolales bacterium ANBcel1]
MAIFVTLLFIGVITGWIYKGFVGEAGPSQGYCMVFGVTGALSGGLIFLFAGLGGELVAGLLAAIFITMSADVLSREVAHD